MVSQYVSTTKKHRAQQLYTALANTSSCVNTELHWCIAKILTCSKSVLEFHETSKLTGSFYNYRKDVSLCFNELFF